MNKTTLYLHSRHRIGEVDPRIFGGFLEHMGRAVYEGVDDPSCTHADEFGFRADVLDALKRLDMTVMRYPGGNFASGYHWQDGVGPLEGRPRVRELAWQSVETNKIGTDEYIALCRRMGWTPMLSVNLGTGSPEEARNWVEYCNCAAGTKFADMRVENGSAEAHKVELWCLGNEMDGPWQIGHVPADQYAIRAQQAAKMMRDVDKSIELIVCGSSSIGIDTYMEWDRIVLDHVGDYADYISLHRYVSNQAGDTRDYLAVGLSVDRQIEEMDAVCAFMQAKRRSPKRTKLCFDEWNVWYKDMGMDGEGKVAPHLIEEVYNLEDALVVAGFLQSFIRHADVVKIANIAQIVNVIAPILTRGDEMLIQSIFYPFEMISKRRSGVSLRVAVEGPSYATKEYGTANEVDSSAIIDGDRLHVFLTNRSLDSRADVDVILADRHITGLDSGEIITGDGPESANSYDRPDAVTSQPFEKTSFSSGVATVELPPLSFAALTFSLECA